jgi:phosphoribosyl 1,2-cyclic phosphodiesterase
MLHAVHLLVLQSGSHGNTLYVETSGIRLLFDAGLTASRVTERLAAYGRDPVGVDALFISHEHSDHIRGAGVYARAFKTPVYITPKTLAAGRRRSGLADDDDVRVFLSGDSVEIGPVTVHTVPTPHDAVDGSIFVVDDGTAKLAIATDVGHVYPELCAVVASVDALYLESNYDEEMLQNGAYPWSLKRRISGPGGHISNRDAAELIARHASDRLQWACLGHLSAENNSPARVRATHKEILGRRVPFHVAPRHRSVGPFAVAPKPQYTQLAFDFGA